ncbi:MarR family winged helix-turn-helix transcriptional regulator [Corallococcus carmarthensis]|uniref:MarR family transcriptional regulator n=1 Tax=Corallococcus carmarthensis TaxID=2316728 RepID=A0A3A8JUF0_9BACT|nr:MarR family transcriptional regulator [Corallococcus carmarthensis]RKG99497.1 MarR family transcriptional regulator [Corallococcus carmarthensis]
MQPKETVGGWDPQSTASFWLNRASRLLLRLQEGRLRPMGFGMGQMPVLHALQDGSAKSQKDLAKWARVEQPTMAELLARMERDGVVQREPNPEDARGSLTSLTRTARQRWPEGKAALMAVEQDVMAGFSAKEKAQLVSLLQRVVENLER